MVQQVQRVVQPEMEPQGAAAEEEAEGAKATPGPRVPSPANSPCRLDAWEQEVRVASSERPWGSWSRGETVGPGVVRAWTWAER